MKLYNQALSVIDNQSNNFIRTLEEKQFKKILFWNAGAGYAYGRNYFKKINRLFFQMTDKVTITFPTCT